MCLALAVVGAVYLAAAALQFLLVASLVDGD